MMYFRIADNTIMKGLQAAGRPHRGRLAPHQRPLAAAICTRENIMFSYVVRQVFTMEK